MTQNTPSSSAPGKSARDVPVPDAVQESPKRHRVTFVLLAALFVSLSAAAVYLHTGRTPGAEAIRTETGSAAIPVPAIPELTEFVGSIQKNQTITQVLLQQGIPLDVVHQIVECARPVYDQAMVKAERLYSLCYTKDGRFRDFRYRVADERYLTVYHDVAADRMVPVMKNFRFETRREHVAAGIESSLFAAVVDAGEKDRLALDLAEIFGSDIDFHTDLQQGDAFRALVEKKYLDGQFVKYGSVLAADFTNQQKVFTGILFEDAHGKPAYYAPDGKALKKSFLKSPLKFGRITSKFSLARRHPILKIVRPHLGVDYAAPRGTPVQSVAAGVVLRAGRSGASGNMVHVRHSGGYETMYLHLSRIAVKKGARVAQGQLVGNVGSTGLSTGPHLDFRIRHHGKPVNPAKVIFPPGNPVQASQFARFAALRDRYVGDLQSRAGGSRQASITSESGPAR